MCYQWLFHWSLTRGADTPTHWQCAATLHCRGFPHSFPDYQGAHRSQRQLSFYISPSHPVFVHSCIFDIFFHYRSIRIYTHMLLVMKPFSQVFCVFQIWPVVSRLSPVLLQPAADAARSQRLRGRQRVSPQTRQGPLCTGKVTYRF